MQANEVSIAGAGPTPAPAWEYHAALVPASWEHVAAAVDQLGRQGWEYVDHFDTQIAVPDAPRDLHGGGKGNGNGNGVGRAQILRAAGAAQKTMPGHYLIFKRPA